MRRKLGWREMIHPLVLKMAKTNYRIQYVNTCPGFEGNAIYMVNHSCKYDFPIAAQAIEKHVWVLVAKQSLEMFDVLGFILNGSVWVDREKEGSRKTAFSQMLGLIEAGKNIVMFPEGTWNLRESLPMLPIYWGGIRLAQQTGRPIIPLVEEYKGKVCYVAYGAPIYIRENDDRVLSAITLRDRMAELRWYIWEQFPVEKRENISADEWKQERERRLKEYPKLDWEYEKSFIRDK